MYNKYSYKLLVKIKFQENLTYSNIRPIFMLENIFWFLTQNQSFFQEFMNEG